MDKFTRRISASIQTWRVACAMAAGLCLLAGATTAAQSRDQLLITPAWLAQHLGDANLVVFHIGPKPDYDAKHIPGARYVAYNTELAIRATDPAPGLSLQMLSPDVLRERLAGLGVSDGSRVVVCVSSSGWVPAATRVIETLRYAGFADASLLDGGLPAWEKGGHPVTSEVPPAKSGQLSALKTAPVVVDADFVKSHLQTLGFAIVDARNTSFYDGSRTGGQPPQSHKTGHIPGAVSVPFDSLLDASGQYKSQDELSAIFTNAGVKSGDTVIAYCHIGQQATAVVFAARLLGFKVMLYDGSFEDWSLRDLPVAKSGGGSH